MGTSWAFFYMLFNKLALSQQWKTHSTTNWGSDTDSVQKMHSHSCAQVSHVSKLSLTKSPSLCTQKNHYTSSVRYIAQTKQANQPADCKRSNKIISSRCVNCFHRLLLEHTITIDYVPDTHITTTEIQLLNLTTNVFIAQEAHSQFIWNRKVSGDCCVDESSMRCTVRWGHTHVSLYNALLHTFMRWENSTQWRQLQHAKSVKGVHTDQSILAHLTHTCHKSYHH